MSKGFTFIEILVSMAILFAVLTALFVVLNLGNIIFYVDSGLLDLQQQTRQAMNGMIREIRQARQEIARPVTVNADGTRIDFFIPGFSNPVSYYLQNNQLIREHPVSNQIVLANDISVLGFCCQGAATCADCANVRIIRVQLQAHKAWQMRELFFPSENENLSEEVRLRQ